MKRTMQITIDDRIYSTTQYPATKGQILLIKLAKILGRPFGLLKENPSSGESSKTNLLDLNIGEALNSILSGIEPEEFNQLVHEILAGTTILENGQNRPILFDTDFAGRYGHLFKLIKEILIFQYHDFLPVLAGFGAAPVSIENRIQAQ